MNQEIFRDIVLDHYNAPRSREPDSSVDYHLLRNPACGDLIKLHLSEQNGKYLFTHQTSGCAAAVASCSIMCEDLSSRSLVDAKKRVESFFSMMNQNDSELPEDIPIEWEALFQFRANPARKTCVELAWTSARNALEAEFSKP